MGEIQRPIKVGYYVVTIGTGEFEDNTAIIRSFWQRRQAQTKVAIIAITDANTLIRQNFGVRKC